MNKVMGLLLILFSVILILWSAIGILGTIEGLMARFPSEGRVLLIQFGKLLLIFPLVGYGGIKAFKKGKSIFSNKIKIENE